EERIAEAGKQFYCGIINRPYTYGWIKIFGATLFMAKGYHRNTEVIKCSRRMT
ncbi:Hypothetical predicted protein, partial [Paramuricea clavata]